MTDKNVLTCRACKEEVKKGATKCPHCGENNPIQNKAKGCLGAIIFIFVIAFGMTIFSDKPSDTQSSTTPSQQDADTNYFVVNHSHKYEVVLERDLSHAARTRFSANIIAPTATTKEDIFGTSANAAKELQLKHRVQVAHVNFLEGKEGKVLYSIYYAPDQKGWQGTESLGHRFIAD